MKYRIFKSVSLVLFAIALGVSFGASAQTVSLPTQENKEGPVPVSVTPQSLSKAADAWRFEVRFNTPFGQIIETVGNAGSYPILA